MAITYSSGVITISGEATTPVGMWNASQAGGWGAVTRAGRTTTFTYASGRLTGASDGVVARAFGYDGGGNLTSVNVS
jgi:YD repeat-containing protein